MWQNICHTKAEREIRENREFCDKILATLELKERSETRENLMAEFLRI